METKEDIQKQISKLTENRIQFYSKFKGLDCYVKDELIGLRDFLLKNLDIKKVVLNEL